MERCALSRIGFRETATRLFAGFLSDQLSAQQRVSLQPDSEPAELRSYHRALCLKRVSVASARACEDFRAAEFAYPHPPKSMARAKPREPSQDFYKFLIAQFSQFSDEPLFLV
jgi:hypothetical protein